jgi:hypothetical protein
LPVIERDLGVRQVSKTGAPAGELRPLGEAVVRHLDSASLVSADFRSADSGQLPRHGGWPVIMVMSC